jgi:pyruvate dehydrogenase E2 component (dihydrolipoamide acetyltransferase)
MAIEVTIPRLGWTMEEGTFADWLKRDGDWVAKGDPLFVLESDKAAQEIESFDEGILRLLPASPSAGDVVRVGQTIAYLVRRGEAAPFDKSPLEAAQPAATPAESAPATAAAGVGLQRPTAPAGEMNAEPRSTPTISPRALRLALQQGIDWSLLQGTGRTGRIREQDVQAAARGPARSPNVAPQGELPGHTISHTAVRRAIAHHMLLSLQETAPVTLTTKSQAGGLVRLRDELRDEGRVVPTYTDLIVKLTAHALEEHPLLNAQWRDDGLFLPQSINIGIAVDTEVGLMVPVIRDVPTLALDELAVRAKELIELARTRRLATEHMQGGTFTVSNLGTYGIDAFTPIIHLPQCAILGVGRLVHEPVVRGEQICVWPMITLSLTFDHRIVDGATAARFLQRVSELLEEPPRGASRGGR